MRSAQNAFAAAVVVALVAIAAIEYGLITHDFSLSVVAEHTSRKLPLIYTITSLWASLASLMALHDKKDSNADEGRCTLNTQIFSEVRGS